MYSMKGTGFSPHLPDEQSHIDRPRVSAMLETAVERPLSIVCAGAGYGKTLAVAEFAQLSRSPVGWIQITEKDNFPPHFWENLTGVLMSIAEPAARKCIDLGFPGTEESVRAFITIFNGTVHSGKFVMVIDDLHLISEPGVIRFLERVIHELPDNISVILITREYPLVNIVDLDVKGLVSIIDEDDLIFTQDELSRLIGSQGLSPNVYEFDEILRDTGGWPFAVNLIIRYLKKSPRYVGYVQRAMKQNIFMLMERETWEDTPENLRRFLVRLSLICHLSAELVEAIADGDAALLSGLRHQNAYVRYDGYIDAYLFHHLFLEFLRAKKDMLTQEELYKTYEKAADWCVKNEFRTDAAGYYAEIGNYGAVVSILEDYPGQIPQDIACFALEIFERAPEDTFSKVDTFAYSHLRLLLSLARWDDIMRVAGRYEALLSGLPDSQYANRALGCQYAILGQARMLMCVADNQYDFDNYYAKMNHCLSQSPVNPKRINHFHIGPWVTMVGSPKKSSLQDYRRALVKAAAHVSESLDGRMTGLEELSLGELNFYQGKLQQATIHILRALEQVRDNGQIEIMHRAYFYLVRIAVSRGNLPKAEQTLRDMQGQKYSDGSDHPAHSPASIFHIPIGWYYYYLQQPQKIPEWLKEGFIPYTHPSFMENYGNQMKAYYCYLSKNYPPLLIYISDLKKQKPVIFSLITMLALEACAYYQMKDKKMAYASLKEAYDLAVPYDILMPFIEMGKDMRTLAASASREQCGGIPSSWLEEVCRRSATYAKRQSLAISEYRRITNTDGERTLSSLEHRVLVDLVNGLSRSDISTEQRLSINTINSVVSSIYDKLNANSIVEVVRVAIDRNLLS